MTIYRSERRGRRPPNTSPDVRQFAGKERDVQTELDYVGARYYRAVSGRFTTVDPVLNVEAALADPQRWNRYSYARSNPLVFGDPDGRDVVMRLWYDQQTLARNSAIRDKVASALGAGAPGDNPVAGLARFVVDSTLSMFLPRSTSEAVESQNASMLGIAAPMELGASKAINLPAWKRVAIDIEHIVEGHTSGGARAIQSGIKSLFPDSMNAQQIETAVRNAYRYGQKLATQGDRVQVRGPWNGGMIDMWVNVKTKVIESAWPYF
jgi:RHS repeat-associated protein